MNPTRIFTVLLVGFLITSIVTRTEEVPKFILEKTFLEELLEDIKNIPESDSESESESDIILNDWYKLN